MPPPPGLGPLSPAQVEGEGLIICNRLFPAPHGDTPTTFHSILHIGRWAYVCTQAPCARQLKCDNIDISHNTDISSTVNMCNNRAFYDKSVKFGTLLNLPERTHLRDSDISNFHFYL